MIYILINQFKKFLEISYFFIMNLLKVTVLIKDFNDVLSAVMFHCEFSITIK